MLTRALPILLLGALALAGCAATTSAAPSPTPTTDPDAPVNRYTPRPERELGSSSSPGRVIDA